MLRKHPLCISPYTRQSFALGYAFVGDNLLILLAYVPSPKMAFHVP